jgi:uncharacterized membrane protein
MAGWQSSRFYSLMFVAISLAIAVIFGVGVVLNDDPVGAIIIGSVWILIGSGWLWRFFRLGRGRRAVRG